MASLNPIFGSAHAHVLDARGHRIVNRLKFYDGCQWLAGQCNIGLYYTPRNTTWTNHVHNFIHRNPWKRATLFFDHNSHISWWTFILFVSMETGMNTLQNSYIIYNFTLTVCIVCVFYYSSVTCSSGWLWLTASCNVSNWSKVSK